MRYISSGESHGEQITVILEGIPANLILDLNSINEELVKRQSGYGRGGRMKIESDTAEIVGGVMFGKTTGAPITIIVKNKDYLNHQKVMSPFNYDLNLYEPIKVPRPGHADLVGAIKYQQKDMRVIFERASARETVSRVCVGAICKQILKQLEINIYSYVVNIGGIEVKDFDMSYLDTSQVRMPNELVSNEAIILIDKAIKNKDTLGGICEVIVENVPLGIGSYVTYESKLDAKMASSILSIQSCKGVEFGKGFDLANHFGSLVHDEIIYDDGFIRKSNNYGGFEGGMTTGMPLVIRSVFKPIPTLMKPLKSVNIETLEEATSHIERSDVCIIPSASIICEHTVAFEILKAITDQFTADTMSQLKDAFSKYREYVKRF